MSEVNLSKSSPAYIEKYGLQKIFPQEILGLMDLVDYGPGQYILRAGEDLTHLYFLVEGQVKISYDFENGKSVFLKFYQGFNLLGDMELVQKIPIVCSVLPVNRARLLRLPLGSLEGLESPGFLRLLNQSLSQKLVGTIVNSSYKSGYPLENRLATYLLAYEKGGEVRFKTSFKEVAQFLGTSYRHLSRSLKSLGDQGLIKKEGAAFKILDLEGLRRLSKEEYIEGSGL